jgi:hypothetical protein
MARSVEAVEKNVLLSVLLGLPSPITTRSRKQPQLHYCLGCHMACDGQVLLGCFFSALPPLSLFSLSLPLYHRFYEQKGIRIRSGSSHTNYNEQRHGGYGSAEARGVNSDRKV